MNKACGVICQTAAWGSGVQQCHVGHRNSRAYLVDSEVSDTGVEEELVSSSMARIALLCCFASLKLSVVNYFCLYWLILDLFKAHFYVLLLIIYVILEANARDSKLIMHSIMPLDIWMKVISTLNPFPKTHFHRWWFNDLFTLKFCLWGQWLSWLAHLKE